MQKRTNIMTSKAPSALIDRPLFSWALHLATLLLILGCADSSGGANDIADADTAVKSCPESHPLTDETACDLPSEICCFTHNNDCANAEVCHCVKGMFACEAVDWDAPCAELENASCPIEGSPGCGGYPSSGVTSCEAGTWNSTYACPQECPVVDPPNNGDACEIAISVICRYGDLSCQCTDGLFACSVISDR